MADHSIQAVLFDMGGTLEDLTYDDATRRQAAQGLLQLLRERDLDPGLSLADLHATVQAGLKRYGAWRQETEIELPPERVWADYILADQGLPPERLQAAAEDLAFYYDTHYHLRCLRPEAPALLAALHARGLRLGIISNVISRRLVDVKLAEYGIAHYFDPILTSSNLGYRKPSARIFEEATRLLRLPPAACAHVGDTISRDVIGARRAGYGLVIQIKSFLTAKSDAETTAGEYRPDAIVDNLMPILDLLSNHTES